MVSKKNINDTIISAIRNNKVVPIIGAGISYFYGFPNWKNLLINLSNEYNVSLDEKMIYGKDYLQVAEALLQKGINDRNLSNDQIQVFVQEFNAKVIECFKNGYDEKERKPKEIQKIQKLKDINFKTIITTNYDNILEDDIFNNKYTAIYPSAGKELNFDEYKPYIMKIHGDVSEAKSIILTQSQYYDFINSKGYFNSKLYTLFTTNIIIMIGYSFRDINVHDIYFKYRNEFKEYIHDMTPKAYMVVTEYDIKEMGKEYYELYKLYLKGNGIEVIEGYKTIGDFIEDFVNSVNEDRKIWGAYEYIKFDENTPITCTILDDIIQGKKISLKEVDTSQINMTVAQELCTLISLLLGEPLELDEFSGRWSGNLDIEGKLPNETCEELFMLIKICIEKCPEIADMCQFGEIAAYALEYADQFRYITNDFYIYPGKFEKFIDIVEYVKIFELNNDLLISFEKNFSSLLNYSGFGYGKCHGSARLLEDNYSRFPSVVFEAYFKKHKENVDNIITDYINEGYSEKGAWCNYRLYNMQELNWLVNKFVNVTEYSSELKKDIIDFVTKVNDKGKES